MPKDDDNRLEGAMLNWEHRPPPKKHPPGWVLVPRGMGEPHFGAVYLRSRSEPFGEESERKAPGGGPLSWGDREVKHFPGEEGAPTPPKKPPSTHPLPTRLQKATGSSILRVAGGGEKLVGNADFWGD